jgi:hypothetical protein
MSFFQRFNNINVILTISLQIIENRKQSEKNVLYFVIASEKSICVSNIELRLGRIVGLMSNSVFLLILN